MNKPAPTPDEVEASVPPISEQLPPGLAGVINEKYTIATPNGPRSVKVAYSYDFVKPQFSADLSPQAEANQCAAKAHGLRYDPRKQAYVDVEGSLVRDKFGQPY